MDPVPGKRPVIQHIVQRLKETERADQFIISGMSTSLIPQVQEKLQAGLPWSPPYIKRLPETMPSKQLMWKLSFQTTPRLPIFKGKRIVDTRGGPLEIILVGAGTGSPTALPQLLFVQLVTLTGDFPPDGRENWTADEFQNGILDEGKGFCPLLIGDVIPVMWDGRAAVNELRFTDDSTWVRGRKFRIGARLRSSFDGARVLEAITEAFEVKDYPKIFQWKHYPPVLNDELWKLEHISKHGAFQMVLAQNNIHTVQEFVRMLMVKLRSSAR
ncbi:Calmodulin-binding protein 60 D [Dichanthelium oligosanthes]|uniref:Calmodulin-binding protein 60 D n=1 Tax=Dichanthelium oligosanthes TaxID=888268 RepID=A0A1E5WIJ9_9POAL|nr:Calmodulin-binding protein 60 D [Dichanthelium oligosanthes]